MHIFPQGRSNTVWESRKGLRPRNLRHTARAPQPPNNPPTEHQMSRQGLAQNDQKCQFWAEFGRLWAKNPNFYWREQKSWYSHNEKTT